MTGARRRSLPDYGARIFFALTLFFSFVVASIVATGGVAFELGPLRVSARRIQNPALGALASAAAAWALSTAADRRRVLAGLVDAIRFPRSHPALASRCAAAAIAAAILVFGLARSTYVAAGSDAHGYVSQADLWARGSLIVRQPFAYEMTWPLADEALAPLGYRPFRRAPHGTDIVPVYPPGVPIVMAAFKLIAGPQAVFWVVPLLAGVAVWSTYLLGARLAGPPAGAASAILMAASPVFLSEMLYPTSDVPATAWWALALALALSQRRSAALGAGLAAGFAILTRPNLAPIAVIAAGMASSHTAARLPRLLLFAAGCAPACVLLALVNWRLYGSPLFTGYGSIEGFYQWSHLWPNLRTYPRQLIDTQTPVIVLALVAPFVLPRTARGIAAGLLGVAAIVGMSYAFYLPFDSPLRFLLPAYPAILALTAAVVASGAARLPRWSQAAVSAAVLLVGAVVWHGVATAGSNGVLRAWEGDQRYLEAGVYIRDNLPRNAALISMEHSGSARYYSGRVTIRYEWILPADLDRVLAELRRLDYHPYLLIDRSEEALFRDRFAGYSRAAALDWTPVASIHDDRVRIYDAAGLHPDPPDPARAPPGTDRP